MSEQTKRHRAGFVNIIGNPNVGKSTLMNALVGEKLSIVTAKAQTTRHRIMGIVNGDDYQIVYSDTPGKIKVCGIGQTRPLPTLSLDSVLYVPGSAKTLRSLQIRSRLRSNILL